MPLFNTSVAQQVWAYLALFRCIKIVGEIATILHTAFTRVDIFPWFYDVIMKCEG
jgi:hypothetical protein